MADVENLDIVIDAIDQFSRDLDRLLFKLGQVATAHEEVDNLTIDVDVRGERELDALLFKLGQLEAADLSGIGDIVVGDKRVSRRSGGGRGISREADDALTSLSGDLSEMFAKVDETLTEFSDEMRHARRTSEGMSESADKAGSKLDLLDLRMSDVNNAVAKLIPLLLVVVGALPAVIGSFVTLASAALAAAAALGALTVFGAVGLAAAEGGGDISEGFLEIARQVQEDFLDAFMPLARQLAPVFEDGLEGLEQLFTAIARQGDTLLDLRDVARDFGSFIIDTLPTFLGDVANFADAFAETLSIVARFGERIDIFEGMAEFMAQALPPLFMLIDGLIRMLPAILNISVGFLEVLGAVVALVSGFTRLLSVIGLAGENMGLLVGAALVGVTAFTLFNTAIVKSIALLAGKFIALMAEAAFSIITYATSMAAGTAATWALTAALTALLSVVTLGLFGAIAGGVASLSSSFVGLGTDIGKATDSLREFKSVSDGLDDSKVPAPESDITREKLRRLAGQGGAVDITIEDQRNPDSNDTRNTLNQLNTTS
jgi:hypothetical protein